MANYTEVLMTDHNFPHIDIINILRDGVSTGYEARTHGGYVMFDTTATNVELDPETDMEVPVTYYYVRRGFPVRYTFDYFPWVAVHRSSVDENYIFGGGSNSNHEVI